MRELWKRIGWLGLFKFVAGGLLGILVGLGLFTFVYAGGLNYFGEDPKTCQQCHAMNKQYNAWQAGSHHNVATCQDCHNPHDNVVHYLASEADNGFWHSLKFTTGNYPENIKIRPVNRKIVEANCLRCHGSVVDHVNTVRPGGEKISCLQCHNEVGHKR